MIEDSGSNREKMDAFVAPINLIPSLKKIIPKIEVNIATMNI